MVGQVLTLLIASLVAGPLAGQNLPETVPLGGAAAIPGRVVLQGNVHRAVRDEMPIGHADKHTPMEHMLLSFRMQPEAKAALEHLLVDLQDPASPRYHQWLTPEQFAAAYGPSPADQAKVTAWLQSQGFTIDEVARGGMSITFSGDAGLVEQAFRTPIMQYQIEGSTRFANAADPSIPAELAQAVGGVVSLHNIPKKAMNTGARRLTAEEAARVTGILPQFTSGSSHYLAPADFATIYNVNPLYSAGITGAGVTIAIVGRTNPGTANWATFRSAMGLPVNTPTIIQNGVTSDLGSAEDGEADLDVEWSGAVAKGATIKFVCSPSGSTDGVDLSAQYIVNNNLAPVMSVSFGQCETSMGATENTFYNNLWSLAASEGISVFVSSGDAGAAGCNVGSDTTGSGGLGVNGLGSTPYNVAVGGTMFQEGAGTYWSSSNTAAYGSALSYIPEVVWNESGSNGGSDLWATGGGASNTYAKPAWQVATGVPAGNHRFVPDVALTAAGHDGYIEQTTGGSGAGLYAVGGTSASSPSFAGLMALIVQQAGRQGNPNAAFYAKATAQVAGGTAMFHDITSGNNSVPGVTGFSAGAGYDEATGLGSVDAEAMVYSWTWGVTPTVNSVGLLTGRTGTLGASVTGGSATLTWSASGGTVTAGSPTTSATFSAGTAGTYTVKATATAADQSGAITVRVQDAHLTGTGATVTGLDVLTLLGNYGTSTTLGDLNADGIVDGNDLNILLPLLGW